MKPKLLAVNLLLLSLAWAAGCKHDSLAVDGEGIIYSDAIPANPQAPGSPAAGWDFLRYGNYNGGGLPYDLASLVAPPTSENVLQRDGVNATLPPEFIAYEADNGVMSLTPSCFTCHGGYLNGQYVLGLGNSHSDYTASQSSLLQTLHLLMENNYGTGSPEWENYESFGRGGMVVAPYIVTPFKGVNPASDLERAAVAHRKLDGSWSDEPLYEMPPTVVASDVPAWWLLKKKNALYYNGMGRGSFTKLIMQTGVVALRDSTQAREVNNHFDDVVAFLQTIEPPAYPESIDQALAAEGESVFLANCQRCHGTYGDNEHYPNRLISVDEVGTDPLYAEQFVEDKMMDWFNDGWFGQSEPKAKAVATRAYIAPPLDGVWATGPYLHNGSVPNIRTLLKSDERPTYWERDFGSSAYDMQLLGQFYTERGAADNKSTYNTTISGYGNHGHTFGDALGEGERQALMEYLKTL